MVKFLAVNLFIFVIPLLFTNLFIHLLSDSHNKKIPIAANRTTLMPQPDDVLSIVPSTDRFLANETP